MSFIFSGVVSSVARFIDPFTIDREDNRNKATIISSLCFAALASLAAYRALKVGQNIIVHCRLCSRLNHWVSSADDNEVGDRIEAQSRILQCYYQSNPSLDLSGLNLTSIPDCLAFLDHIRDLNLMINNLEVIPDSLVNLRHLRRLNITHNSITSIPYFMAIRSDLELITDQVQLFQIMHEITRRMDRVSEELNLEKELNFWFSLENEHTLDTKLVYSLFQIEDVKQNNLAEFLFKLKETADYKNPITKRRIIERVVSMLIGIGNDKEFAGLVFSIIHESLSSCVDRIALAFDEIESSWIMHFELAKMNMKEKASFLIGSHRKELLQKAARKICAQLLAERREIDEIEIYLNLQTELRVQLELPNTTSSMIFSVYGVSSSQIRQIGNQIFRETSSLQQKKTILLSSMIWNKILAEEPSMKEIDELMVEKTEALFELESLDQITHFQREIVIQIERNQRDHSIITQLRELNTKPINLHTAAQTVALLREAKRLEKSREITTSILSA